ncbi:MAG: excinuclease ABC subunit UvrC [Flavobacteriales bacterium]|nr:excinuclease ABC subunit UvrC [Flavobacteriales bacterium]
MIDGLKNVVLNLPNNPGVYKYYDQSDKIIYVGKAKNLKKRVSSYFTKSYENGKTKVLVSKIVRIEYTVVDNEMEALLLENNLIKQHQPRYNMMLKDDKSFPLIKLTNERFPRIFAMRNPVYDGSEYFGPYTSAKSMHTVLDFIKSLYALRNCNYNLSEENVESGKFKACLEYQLGNCNAPCIGKETEEQYMESVQSVKQILKGNYSEVKKHLSEAMFSASKNLEFENAQKFKRKIELLEMFKNKSTVVNHRITNVDVFSVIIDGQQAFVNYLKVHNGVVVQTKSVEYKLKLEEKPEDVLCMAIPQLRDFFASDSKEIIVPMELELFENLKVTVPKVGDKRKLLELSIKNALFYKKQKIEQYDKLNPENKTNRLMEKMKNDLRLKEEPRHIECFDNSNLQGTNPVSACVVFKDGKPSKKEYRHFNVKTVVGPNDFESMKEVVYRRYKRLKEEQKSLPQLIIIDGGKGQLSSAVESLKELDLYGSIAIVGIAKRLEEIYYPEDSLPLYIDKKSETLKIIQHLRDEAHRFGITFHRNQRSRKAIKSELFDIEGVGDKTVEALLKKFKSIKKIKTLTLNQLSDEIGNSKGKIVFDYFQENGG